MSKTEVIFSDPSALVRLPQSAVILGCFGLVVTGPPLIEQTCSYYEIFSILIQ